MRTSHLREEPSTRFNVEEMSRKIEIEVPEEFHRLLETVAAQQGISLSDLVKRELGLAKKGLSFEELDARVQARGPWEGSTDNTVRYIRESRGD